VRLVPRSLHTRLVLLFTVGTAVVLVLCLWLLNTALDRQLDGALTAELTGRHADLVAAVRAGDLIAVGDDPLAQLYGPDGSVLAGSPALSTERLLSVGDARAVVKPTRLDDYPLLGAHDLPVHVEMLASRVSTGGDILVVGAESAVIESAGSDQFTVLLLAAPLLIAALALAGWLTVRAALRPVDLLSREAAEISSLDTDRRLTPVPGDDEVARLARTLDGMLARLRVAFARERAFVDDASHELRTPLAVLRGEIDLALTALDDPAEVEQSLRNAQGQIDRLTRLAEDLLLLARDRAGALSLNKQPLDLLDLLRTEAQQLGPAVGVRIATGGDAVVTQADPARLRQVLANLAANSATAGAGQVQVRLTTDPDGVRLEWSDDGPGFPAGLLDAAFERFVRGDAARSPAGGAGLGLSIVRAIVGAHDGTIGIHNGPPLGGAVVTIHLPL
jgi:two-component system, OmpR family, sensor kinase